MPIIAMFLGILIRMQYDDHLPPHFHAEYGESSGTFNLEGDMLNGDMPTKYQTIITAWTLIHQDELRANWIVLREAVEPFRIEGVRF
ncbi:MAG: DUF4160 domain-containing protein [Synergistaceae bacterium]|nr:DUF4160 domain-containing protein [Synergistaceae bacterium]